MRVGGICREEHFGGYSVRGMHSGSGVLVAFNDEAWQKSQCAVVGARPAFTPAIPSKLVGARQLRIPGVVAAIRRMAVAS